MVSDSQYWKNPLLATATWLRRFRYHEDLPERRVVEVERRVLFGFYSIRKLCEAWKVSDNTKRMMVKVTSYPQIKSVDYLNFDKIDELYDLQAGIDAEADLLAICNQFIHSYVFMPVSGQADELVGFYVSSDRTRQTKLYFISTGEVLRIFRIVGRDYPNRVIMVRDPVTLQFRAVIETVKD